MKSPNHTLDTQLTPFLATDAKIAKLIAAETQRQHDKLGLIPSENHISPAVSAVLATCLSSKYSEGYPNRRYYEGNQNTDPIELFAQDRIKQLFNDGPAASHKPAKGKTAKGKVVHVNVQPYSGSPANSAIQFALLEPGDTLMGLALSSGGHLTHGQPKVTFSGKYFKSIQFGLDAEARIDFDQMKALVLKHKPKLIMAGTTAYPFTLDFAKFREIADLVGAWLVADISHITGLVVAGEHMSPVPYVDVIMSTTHKTFRGPRGAMILVTDRGVARDEALAEKIDKAVFPGLQGGPHNATTAGIAIAALEAQKPAFKKYAQRITANAQALSTALKKEGLKLVGDGTENHLLLIDLTPYGDGFGTQVAFALDVAGIYANRNTIPNEPCSPFYPSGLRIGTPLITTRGLKPADMAKLASWIARTIEIVKADQLPAEKTERTPFLKKFRAKAVKNAKLLAIAKEVKKFANQYPLFQW
jgi:glycine hydroxymethyltransferase